MRRRTRMLIGGTVLLALAGAGAGTAAAAAGDDGDGRPITGPALAAASAAALAHTGGGRVTETEMDDEDGYYEVEVTLADGRQVDVHLDRDFTVTGGTADEDNSSNGER
jgi:hypothetical protein